jgi:hypothetical protein
MPGLTGSRFCGVCGRPNARSVSAKYCSTKCGQRAGARLGRERKVVRAAKVDKICADCHKPWPYYVLQFDHVPAKGTKRFNLSHPTGRSEGEILEEIAKCDILCANCHMIRTWQRGSAK